MHPSLGDLQQLVMLAVVRLKDQAFSGAIRDELKRVGNRDVAVGTVHVTLVRLEDQGMLTSGRSERSQPGAGRPRRCYTLTPEGWGALSAARESFESMWSGVEPA